MMTIFKIFMTVVLVVGVSFSSVAKDCPKYKYLKYDPSSEPEYPYIYSDFDYSGATKENMQSTLSIMTCDSEEFIRVFDYFNQFDGGLDINWRTGAKYNHSYLVRATALEHWDIVKPLMDRGIDLDLQSSGGGTALMFAAYCGHLPTVGRLVVSGADLTLVDEDGDSALSNAKIGQQENDCPEGDYEEVISYLEQALLIDHPEGIPERELPQDTRPDKYGAIAFQTGDPTIRTISLNHTSASLADHEARKKCNTISGEPSGCEVAAVFSSGRCGAYAIAQSFAPKGWGVGVAEGSAGAEAEALEMCQATAKSACRVVISECQGKATLPGPRAGGTVPAGRNPALTGGTLPQTAEVEIPGFTFGCTTPSGTKIKPKFGDIYKARYTLPGEQASCLRKVDAAIHDGCNHGQLETFRGAAFFMNEDEAQQYAGCLSIFRLQAQECVAQYGLQRPRCEG